MFYAAPLLKIYQVTPLDIVYNQVGSSSGNNFFNLEIKFSELTDYGRCVYNIINIQILGCSKTTREDNSAVVGCLEGGEGRDLASSDPGRLHQNIPTSSMCTNTQTLKLHLYIR